MQKIKKMLKALDLVAPQGVYAMGLIVNKTEKKIMWNKMPYEIKKVDIDENKDEIDLLKNIFAVLKYEKWLVLDLKIEMPSRIFAALKQLSLSNHIQFTENDKLIELKQPEKSRVVVICNYAVTKKNEEEYAGFKNLFGPVIII